jgi:hypothetical protein
MLRIESQRNDGHYAIVLHGSVAGEWVSLLDRYWRSICDDVPSARIKVVLTDVVFIDHDGEHLLERMWRQGVELEAHGCMNRHMIDRIRMQVRRPASRAPGGRSQPS